ncbi:MAG: LacI family DNA-binding transcriptional regulator [Sedimentisphaeraceae bacterium JB056]
MASVIDIAKEAGVSQATVSRVINGNSKVSSENVAKVEHAMDLLGYNPRRRGGKRVNGLSASSVNVAVMILSYDIFQDYSHIFNSLLRSISHSLSEQGLNAIQTFVFTKDQIPPAVKNGHVAGVILGGTSPQPEVLEELKDYPQVWISSRHDQGGDTALVGNEVIGQMAKDYLVGRGHRHLAFLCATVNHPALIARGSFFEFAAKKDGLEVDVITSSNDMLPADFKDLEDYLEDLVIKFIALKERPTGIFIPMDMQVAIVYRLFKKHGIEVGRDVEIVGCENDKVALMGLYPRPATIDVGADAMGRQAVELLLWRIMNPDEAKRVCISVVPELIDGETLEASSSRELCECL